jgi:outer membrane protein assembly factor BamE (lipoprotein component of BamABCDE complex)
MRLALGAALLALVAGCANPLNAWDVAPGTSREQVLARSGQPTAVVALPGGGQRLQYSMQPFGHDVIMVDLDAAGKVVRSRNVMTPSEFYRIEPGRWTRDDVLREFGRPAWVDAVQSWQGSVFTYRWKEGNEPMFYWVYFDPQGIVRRAHPGIEFINAPDERR